MRHGNSKCAIISIEDFCIRFGSIEFHAVYNGESIDNTCQIEGNGTDGNGERDFGQSFQNIGTSADCTGTSLVIDRVLICSI